MDMEDSRLMCLVLASRPCGLGTAHTSHDAHREDRKSLVIVRPENRRTSRKMLSLRLLLRVVLRRSQHSLSCSYNYLDLACICELKRGGQKVNRRDLIAVLSATNRIIVSLKLPVLKLAVSPAPSQDVSVRPRYLSSRYPAPRSRPHLCLRLMSKANMRKYDMSPTARVKLRPLFV